MSYRIFSNFLHSHAMVVFYARKLSSYLTMNVGKSSFVMIVLFVLLLCGADFRVEPAGTNSRT